MTNTISGNNITNQHQQTMTMVMVVMIWRCTQAPVPGIWRYTTNQHVATPVFLQQRAKGQPGSKVHQLVMVMIDIHNTSIEWHHHRAPHRGAGIGSFQTARPPASSSSPRHALYRR